MFRKLFDAVFHDFWLKLLSVAIALLIWYGLARDPVAEVAFNVPIEFRHPPDNLEYSVGSSGELTKRELLPTVEIRVRGPERVLRQLTYANIHPVLDLQGAGVGERTYTLAPKNIQLPPEIEVVRVIPSQLHIAFDKRAYRLVDVRPRVLGTFASGYRIAQVKTMPDKIEIVGPAHRVQLIDSVLTDPVDASGVIGTVTFNTAAHVGDPLVRAVNPETIRVTVITEKSFSKNGAP
ncbi:MAG TPA: CdaR family protein [Candidatus Acidoferrales bacterium]|nr:CdaR family protein [Candidatus Acidoferrales bacterium]